MTDQAAARLRADAYASVSRIVEAARRVFASGDGTGPLTRIATEAGVGIATLYRHFPNRETLARAVYERIFAERVEPVLRQAADAEADALGRLLFELVERLSDVSRRERGLVASVGNLTTVVAELLGRSGIDLAPALRRAQDAGTVRADLDPADIPQLIAILTAAVSVLDTDRAVRRRYLRLLLDAIDPSPGRSPLPVVTAARKGHR